MAGSNNFPKHIIVRIQPPAPEGLAVRFRFGMRAKNSFSYLVFLGPNGIAEVSGEELLRAFDEQRNAFIMDYGDPRIGFTGEIESKVFSPIELQNALDAFKTFDGKVSFPQNYEDRLKNALRLRQIPGEYRVEVQAVP